MSKSHTRKNSTYSFHFRRWTHCVAFSEPTVTSQRASGTCCVGLNGVELVIAFDPWKIPDEILPPGKQQIKTSLKWPSRRTRRPDRHKRSARGVEKSKLSKVKRPELGSTELMDTRSCSTLTCSSPAPPQTAPLWRKPGWIYGRQTVTGGKERSCFGSSRGDTSQCSALQEECLPPGARSPQSDWVC